MDDTMAPIGMFDSGLGGLSVLRDVRALLPSEHILYVADSAWCPYGVRPEAEIRARSIAVANRIVAMGAKLLIVACNTATSVALPSLRARMPIPVVGLVPAVKPAAVQSRNKRIGVLATPRTVAGERLESLIREFANDVEVHVQAAPGLADLVEAGLLTGAAVDHAVATFVRPLARHGVDTIVLGCTHYPFLRDPIRRAAGPDVAIIDSGDAVARRTEDLLRRSGQLRGSSTPGNVVIMTSGNTHDVGATASRLLAEDIEAITLGI
ncbi:MAG: glutamate racemase [Propionibacteriaceae bacterium]|nr:glutamate racemase [Propionibacteriaceae bacterium]